MNLFEEAVREMITTPKAVEKMEGMFCSYSRLLGDMEEIFKKRLITVMEIAGLELEDVDFDYEVLQLVEKGNYLAKEYIRLGLLKNNHEEFTSVRTEIFNEFIQ